MNSTHWRYTVAGGSQVSTASGAPTAPPVTRADICLPPVNLGRVLGLLGAPPLQAVCRCACGRAGGSIYGGACLRCWQARGER